MLFNSLEFIVFIFFLFPLYWFAAKRRNVIQNIILVVASCVFYAWVDWRFLLLIALTAASTYFTSLGYQNKNKRKNSISFEYSCQFDNSGILQIL